MHKERSQCARLKTAIAILAVCTALPAARGDRFAVTPGTPGAAPDGVFATWATAATNIQNAVNAATAGETVWVTNGVYYSTGAGMTSNSMVYIDKPITVRGLNGRDATFLDGNYPAFTNRAFHLTHTNAVVMGFTVTNCGQFAAAAQGGGIWVGWGTVTDCRIVRCGSRSVNGGGVFLYAEAPGEGKAWLSNSVIHRCTAGSTGGGAHVNKGVIANCEVYDNLADNGGGIYVHYAGIRNCLSRNNRVYANGCGVWINYNGGMLNCTVSHNSHATGGNAGGVHFAGTLGSGRFYTSNSIVYYNGNTNFSGNIGSVERASVGYTCTWPTTDMGAGAIDSEPLFMNPAAGNLRLRGNSPCVNRGTNEPWMLTGTDLDGGPRIHFGTVDMGAYEHLPPGTIFMLRGQ